MKGTNEAVCQPPDLSSTANNQLAEMVRSENDGEQLEGQSLESEGRLRSIFEFAPDAYYLSDLEGNFVDGNRAAEELTGYTRDELTGKNLVQLQLLSPGQLPKAPALLAKNSGHQPTEPCESTFVRKDGGQVTLEIRTCPVTIRGEALVLGIARDITERKRMQDALRESEKRYRLLAENISDVIWTMDMGLHYTYVSPSVTRQRGYKVEEVLAQTARESLTPPSFDVALEALAEELELESIGQSDPNRSRTLELELYCKDGSTAWCETEMTFLRGPDSRPAGILGVSRAITERKRMQDTLRESEKHYRLLAENVSDVIWTADGDLRYTYVSPSVERLRGYTVEELMKQSVRQSLMPTSLETVREVVAKMMTMPDPLDLTAHQSSTLELELNCKDGSTIWAETKITAMRDENGRPVGILGVTRDISQRKRADAQLRESEELYSAMAHRSQIGVYIVQDGRFVFANPQFQEDTGYTEDQLLGADPLMLVHAEDRVAVRNNAVMMLKGERSSAYEYRGVDKAGKTKWIMESVASIQYRGRRATLGNYMDITERKQAEEAIRHMALHDALTGLPNRTAFDDRLNAELAGAQLNGQMLALLFLDLDRFKEVNDSFGHKAGDRALQAIGQRLARLLRGSDTVARIGGDEFTVILPRIGRAEDAANVAKRILSALREPFALDGLQVEVTATIGIAIYPDDGDDVDALMTGADTALYRAKEGGADTYLRYAPAMEAETPQNGLLPSQGPNSDDAVPDTH